MNERKQALRQLELAFRNWYWSTGQDEPSIGILVVGLSHEGADLQYLGREPNAVIDWPTLFALIIQELERGNYRIDPDAGVQFPHPQ